MTTTPPLPTRDDDYSPPPGTIWSPSTWGAVIGDVGVRLRAIEAQRNTLQDLIDDLRLFGLQRLDEAIVPLIQAQQAALATLQSNINAALAQTSQIVTNFQASTNAALAMFQTQVDTALDGISDDIAALQTQVDTILAGGLLANNVVETATRVFLTPAQKSQIAANTASISSLATTVGAITLASLGGEPKWTESAFSTAATATLTARVQDVVDTSGGAKTRTVPNDPPADYAARVTRKGSGLLTIGAGNSVFRTHLGDVTTLEITRDGLSLEIRRAGANVLVIR